jgi:hypothetical protein
MSEQSRVVELSPDVYVGLMAALWPTERWMDNGALVLWTAPNKRLCFVPKKEAQREAATLSR